MRRSKIIGSSLLIAFLLGSLLAACQGREQDVKPQATADMAEALRLWNEEDIEGFVAHVDATYFLEDRAEAVSAISGLRQQLGAVNHQAEILIDGKPDDSRAWAIAHLVMTTERGLGRLSLVYARDLRIVGFNISGQEVASLTR